MIFEGLDCPLRGIHAVIVGFDELKFYFFFVEKFFDGMWSYIIHDIVLWAKSSIFQIFYVFGESIDDGIIRGTWNWCR